MAKFALLLPREEMVEPAGRIARELGMEVVLNRSVATEHVLEQAETCRALGADILVARGRQASILKEHTDLPVVEIRLTGLEIALLLHRAKSLVPRLNRPKVGVVTIPNMVGEVQGFEEVMGIELHTYFVAGTDETEKGVEQAVADGMDVILGGDFANACCRRLGKRTLFMESTEDSLRTSLRNARSVGFASDAERRNTAHLQVLLDYSFNGIIELDDKGVVARCNDMACKILARDREELVGQPLSALMPPEDQEVWTDALARNQELYFSVLNVAGAYVVANAVPVTDQGAAEGMIFSFYEMHKMESQGERALRERYRLQRYLAYGRFEDVSHTSREMARVVRLARTFAGTTQPILLRGEVGSGKSLFAQSIHNASPCSKGPFVTFDCGASWEDQQGALIRAAKDADTGTLYLDHLEDLQQGGQHALCRLIREGVIHLTGESAPEPVTVRVIVSTADREVPRIKGGGFLPELAYILTPHQLDLPPLRSRPDDLEQAITMCLDDCVTKLNRYVVLTKEAKKVLMSYPWPGNYIQLHTFLERMALTAPSRTIKDSYVRDLLEQLYPDDIPLPHEEEQPATEEAARIIAALSRCGGSRAEAAAQLGMSKTTLWRRMKQYGIRDRY
ncbi:PrpR N-terminal domain-containing protein [Intestinimonas massiliensis (ex Afouda et al. 2020)]|uniref:PrpR N-terminal domain-containing protein n=1 Tax=Intestinimonas massiliensis (ex Afouda et al. 2020) TaxID=1673721 RepID=UPI0010323613|nr:PrpR N-terminal domain-containing protein [Intestinimonas massiliensis (ex Afouda et al. 2020)]